MSFAIPQHYSSALSFEQQLLYALSKLKKGSAGEIAIELMELQGVSTEEGVADLTIHTEKQLEKLCTDGQVEIVRENHEKKRYKIRNEFFYKLNLPKI
jgi:hypothetical protein